MQLHRALPRRPGPPLALTIGNFDGVHTGHRAMAARLAAAARARGLDTGVMVFEPHPREFFAPATAPARLTPLRDKAEALAALGIDHLFVCRFDAHFAARTPEAFVRDLLVERLGVRWLLVGDDFRFGARRAGDVALLRAMAPAAGFEVDAMGTVLDTRGQRASSTAVRTALAAGDLDTAARLIGRPYAITGRVIGGDRIGRTLGFPTANIKLDLPRPALAGIFAVEVHGAAPHPVAGAASLGTRPTVTDAGRPSLEVFLLDFSGDLYRRRLRVDFLARLRDEEKYPDLPTLRAAIDRDVAATRAFFAARAATAPA